MVSSFAEAQTFMQDNNDPNLVSKSWIMILALDALNPSVINKLPNTYVNMKLHSIIIQHWTWKPNKEGMSYLHNGTKYFLKQIS